MNRQNRRQMLRLYLGMLLSVLLASLFFSGLYRFNNKYTQHTTADPFRSGHGAAPQPLSVA